MRIRSSALLASSMALLAGAAHAGTYVTTLVGTPNDTVRLSDINEAGVVVGSVDGQGMIWRHGIATPLESPPGASFVAALSITPYGIVLGQDRAADGTPGTYTYNTVRGSYRQLAVPGLANLTGVSISNNGNIAGYRTVPSAAGTRSFATWPGGPGALRSGAGFMIGIAASDQSPDSAPNATKRILAVLA